jgi:hypothetical protein
MVLDDKKPKCSTLLLQDLDLNEFFGMFKTMENGTLNLETET